MCVSASVGKLQVGLPPPTSQSAAAGDPSVHLAKEQVKIAVVKPSHFGIKVSPFRYLIYVLARLVYPKKVQGVAGTRQDSGEIGETQICRALAGVE